MTTREEIVAEARTWIGTPFHHQGRVKGRGVDCAGLIVGTARACGIAAGDMSGYSRTPSGGMLQEELERQCDRVSEALPGDIYLMRFEREPQHVAFATDIGVLHAYANARTVAEHVLDDKWRRRIVAVYRLRGIE